MPFAGDLQESVAFGLDTARLDMDAHRERVAILSCVRARLRK
jgi:hypothetical protein